MSEAKLHRNIQFTYETGLAYMELESFGAEDINYSFHDPGAFRFNGLRDTDGLVRRSAYFATINEQRTVYSELITPAYQHGRFNLTRSVNQYLTHWIYPYKGKFHPQMIRAILNLLHLESGARVLDPFSGSGTTAVEAMLLGLDVTAIDISPLCVLQGKVKTEAWREAAAIIDLTDDLLATPDDDTLLKNLDSHHNSKTEVIRDFFELARMVVLSDVEVRQKKAGVSLRRNLPKMVGSVVAMGRARKEFGLTFGKVDIHRGDVLDLKGSGISPDSIDAIVTSPPYSIALDYVKNDEHAIQGLGYEPSVLREELVGVRGRPRQRMQFYREDMKLAFAQMAKVLKHGGVAVVVIGDATIGTEVTTTGEMLQWAEAAGLACYKTLPKIVFGLYNVMQEEKVHFFRKE